MNILVNTTNTILSQALWGKISTKYLSDPGQKVIHVSDKYNGFIKFNQIPDFLGLGPLTILLREISSIRAYDLKFINTLRDYLENPLIKVVWLCGWQDTALPLMLFSDYQSKYYAPYPSQNQTKMDQYLHTLTDNKFSETLKTTVIILDLPNCTYKLKSISEF